MIIPLLLAFLSTLVTFGLASVLTGVFLPRKVSIELSKNRAITTQFSILIPAHNESGKLQSTLTSIENELKECGLSANILIGLDQTTDHSVSLLEEIRASLPHLQLLLFPVNFRNKWKTLKSLLEQVPTESEWVILVDAGTQWKEGILHKILFQMGKSNVVAVAPSYRIHGGSRLSAWFWQVERLLKNFENRVQGPVSVHGACVAYRASALEWVFQKLGSLSFKNDDVILPLALRIFFPEESIVYLEDAFVFDQAEMEDLSFGAQFIRRKRMVLGNLQWIRWLMKESHHTKIPLRVWAVALRRMFRPFWAETILVFGVACVFYGGVGGAVCFIPLLLFPAAALASLYAPIAWLMKWDQDESSPHSFWR